VHPVPDLSRPLPTDSDRSVPKCSTITRGGLALTLRFEVDQIESLRSAIASAAVAVSCG